MTLVVRMLSVLMWIALVVIVIAASMWIDSMLEPDRWQCVVDGCESLQATPVVP